MAKQKNTQMSRVAAARALAAMQTPKKYAAVPPKAAKKSGGRRMTNKQKGAD